jgi:hypothetical protein
VFGTEIAGGPAEAAVIIGVVLVEALVLYVGYGILEALVGPAIRRALGGE